MTKLKLLTWTIEKSDDQKGFTIRRADGRFVDFYNGVSLKQTMIYLFLKDLFDSKILTKQEEKPVAKIITQDLLERFKTKCMHRHENPHGDVYLSDLDDFYNSLPDLETVLK